MTRYKFRLERLLSLRRHTERMWEMRLAEATGACALLENRIRGLREENREYASLSSGGFVFSAAEILARGEFCRRLEHETRAAAARLEEAAAKREEVGRAYREASRARKVLDKLKERKAEEYYEEQRRGESKIMDEMAMSQILGREGDE
ncbi:MAG: flagellar export protein FliJ [Spirochaetaceae bacterium]|nr:flagellar export protein FliJ [Spirochaetaceae bacterium]